MRYIKFVGSTGYCGTQYEEVDSFSDNTSDDEISEFLADMAQANAELYEYLVNFENEEDIEIYYENALDNCGWEEISEEEYNAYRR